MGRDCDVCHRRLSRFDRFEAYLDIKTHESPRLIHPDLAEGPLEKQHRGVLGYIVSKGKYLVIEYSDERDKHFLERAMTTNEGICIDCAFKHHDKFDSDARIDLSAYFDIDYKPRLRLWWDDYEMTIDQFVWLYNRIENVQRAEVLPLPGELIRIVLDYMGSDMDE